MPTEPIDLTAAPPGPDRPTIEPGETVHVWLASVDADTERRDALAPYLSITERERAARFRFADDATRYTIVRGLLRVLLARYVGGSPSTIALAETEHGRPYRQNPTALDDLDFNLSHSGDLALFAFGRALQLGVDLEQVQPLPDMDDLVGINFSQSERESYAGLDPRDRERAFFCCWTRKEAFVKAVGEGLSHPLDAFDVTFLAGDAPQLLRLASAPEDLPRWSLYALDPGDGYAAALAIRASGEKPGVHGYSVTL